MAKSYKTDAFGVYTTTGESLGSRFPVLPPGEKVVIVAASTKADVEKDVVISILSGDMAEVVSKIGNQLEAPEAFYAARLFLRNGGRYIDFVIGTSVDEHLTVAEATTQAVLDAVVSSDASLVIVPKPSDWTTDGYGANDAQQVDKEFIDLMATVKHDRMFYITMVPHELDYEAAIDYVTDENGVNKQSKVAAFYWPNAYVSNVIVEEDDEAEDVKDISAAVAGLYAKIARENPRGVAKAPAGSKADYHLTGLNRLEFDVYRKSDTVKASLQNALINPIMSNNGIYIFGASTLLADVADVYRHVNITRQIAEIKQQVVLIADENVFDNNDDMTRTQLKSKVEAYLQTLTDTSKITEFNVVVVQNETVASELDVTVTVKPVFPNEFIVFTVTADASSE